jgi:hypothetical protein
VPGTELMQHDHHCDAADAGERLRTDHDLSIS